MQDAEFEKVRKEMVMAETAFRKGKDEIFAFPRAVHPLAVASKSLAQTFELLYPKDNAFYQLGSEFSDAFMGLVAAYNDMVRKSWDSVEYFREGGNFECGAVVHSRQQREGELQREGHEQEDVRPLLPETL